MLQYLLIGNYNEILHFYLMFERHLRPKLDIPLNNQAMLATTVCQARDSNDSIRFLLPGWICYSWKRNAVVRLGRFFVVDLVANRIKKIKYETWEKRSEF